jgi:hypothetical protein
VVNLQILFDQLVVANFIMRKYFTIIFIFMKRTREPHVIGLQIELHKVFLHKIDGEEMFFQK